MSKFQFPWEFDFAPFFTIQPNLQLKKLQLETWRSIILDYCQFHNIHQLHLRDWLGKEPFCNPAIGRKLSLDALKTIIGSMVEKRFAEWVGDRANETCVVYARPPEQWAEIIYKYVKDNGCQNTVMTYYELLEGDATKSCEFHRLDELIFTRALKVLEKGGKAAIIEMDGSKGVKFT